MSDEEQHAHEDSDFGRLPRVPSDSDWVRPIILHIPHASTRIPTRHLRSFCLDETQLRDEIRLMSDAYTDELFQLGGCARVVSQMSRLLVDPERFRDAESESMSAVGMNACYTHTASGDPLRTMLDDSSRELLLEEYYDPHHASLNHLCQEMLDERGRCLVVDCHSFPFKALPYENRSGERRPDICIGSDNFHTPKALEELTVSLFEELGYSVDINTPFSGCLTPSKFYRELENVHSVMIELNRALYMNEETGQKSDGFKKLFSQVSNLLGDLAEHSKDL